MPNNLARSPLVAVRDHSLDPVHVRAEAPQLHLLALARLDRQRVRVHPLVRGHVRGLRCVREDVEHRWLVDDRQERHRRDDLLEDVAYFCLDLRFRLCGSAVGNIRPG